MLQTFFRVATHGLVPIYLQRFARLLSLMAIIAICHGQWAALQSLAWGRMLIDNYSATQNVATAMMKTFDGEHPCSLCKDIAKNQQQEKQQQTRVRILKIDLFHEIAALAFVPLSSEPMNEIAPVPYSPRTDEPSVPPPRLAT